jgi:hypothetical protein
MRRLTTSATFAGRDVSTKQMESAVPAVLLRSRLRGVRTAVLSNQEFERLAKECGVSDPAAARAPLIDSGAVVDLGTHIHLRPAQFLQQTVKWEGPVREAEEDLVSATQTMDAHSSALDGTLQALSRKRKAIWGCALTLSGAQLAIISRLTYFDLDWDTMEPISYFLGTGTSLVFYLYLLWFRREHSYTDFDHTFVASGLRAKASHIDWSQYDTDAAHYNSVKLRRTTVGNWMKHN